jgi:hypothetical protein
MGGRTVCCAPGFVYFAFAEADVDEPLVRKLHSGQFCHRRHEHHWRAGYRQDAPGHGAIGGGHSKAWRVRFFSTVELVNALEQEKKAQWQSGPDCASS